MPTLAQASPVFGVVIGEFNRDGHPDVFLAQNFYGPQAETGRADGGVGLLLVGNGDGTFSPLPPYESGIVVPGDATSACLADMDNDGNAEILVATNDGPTYAFGKASPDASVRVIRLQGSGGNSQAAGATVSVNFSNGTVHSAEVPCGGGYLSQSTVDLFCRVPEGARIASVDVSWSNGEKTSFVPGEDGGRISISQPE